MKLLDSSPKESLDFLIQLSLRFKDVDVEEVYNVALRSQSYYKASNSEKSQLDRPTDLQARWYQSLLDGEPDWSVYSSYLYLSDLWACWVCFTRPSFRRILVPSSLAPHGVIGDIGRVSTVADLGCGVGFTTAALAEMFPLARIIATNLLDTPQATIAQAIGKQWGFPVLSSINEIEGGVDLVVATEYFEHIQEPISHLEEVLTLLKPKRLLIANAFGTRSVGHFDSYVVDGTPIESKEVGNIFNKRMVERGYEKIQTKVWNNRPSYWRLA